MSVGEAANGIVQLEACSPVHPTSPAGFCKRKRRKFHMQSWRCVALKPANVAPMGRSVRPGSTCRRTDVTLIRNPNTAPGPNVGVWNNKTVMKKQQHYKVQRGGKVLEKVNFNRVLANKLRVLVTTPLPPVFLSQLICFPSGRANCMTSVCVCGCMGNGRETSPAFQM